MRDCPHCKCENSVSYHAFSISEDCYAECKECGFYTETEVPWNQNESVESHDSRCIKTLDKKLEIF